MDRHRKLLLLCAAAALPSAAFAQSTDAPTADPPSAAAPTDAAPAADITITGSVLGISQYRLRGISQSDEKIAVQGTLTVSHKSGFYVSAFSSSLAGYGTFGGANVELDAIGGYTTTFGDTALDGGLVWYFYPGTTGHQYAEVYGSVSHPIGPVKAKAGFNYAPKRKSIGDADNLWVYTDLALPLENTPVTLKGHLGYTTGKGSIFAGPTGHVLDYSASAEFNYKALTLAVAYVDTDIGKAKADAFFSVPDAKAGHSIVDGAVLFSVGAAF